MHAENNPTPDPPEAPRDDEERLQRAMSRAFAVARQTNLRVDEKSSTLPTAWLLYILSTLVTVAFLWFGQTYITKKEASENFAPREDFLELKRSDRAISDALIAIKLQLEILTKKNSNPTQ
jgi:hypothetical protein